MKKINNHTKSSLRSHLGGQVNGFTLFELLVTISIIAVLTAVAVVSYGGLNKKTRDSRRMADLEKIRISLEAARQIGSTYPSALTGLVSGGFLDRVPQDPKTKGNYPYRRITTLTYEIGSSMEDLGSTNVAPTAIGGTTCSYRLTQP